MPESAHHDDSDDPVKTRVDTTISQEDLVEKLGFCPDCGNVSPDRSGCDCEPSRHQIIKIRRMARVGGFLEYDESGTARLRDFVPREKPVWISSNGDRQRPDTYHCPGDSKRLSCRNNSDDQSAFTMSLETALRHGLAPCSHCFPGQSNFSLDPPKGDIGAKTMELLDAADRALDYAERFPMDTPLQVNVDHVRDGIRKLRRP